MRRRLLHDVRRVLSRFVRNSQTNVRRVVSGGRHNDDLVGSGVVEAKL